MSSGFPGGGADLYGGLAGRSIANTMNGNASQPSYRSQIPGIFMDPAAQIANRTPQSLIGKRTFTDFQTSHQQLPQHSLNPNLSSLFLRSVKRRPYQNMSPVDFTANNGLSDLRQTLSHHYALPLLQHQVRPPPQLQQQQQQQLLQQQQAVGVVSGPNNQQISPSFPGVGGYMNNSGVQSGVQAQDSEKKMLNRLQELEKQLLDDNDEEEGDAVSVITNSNSEWSETMQNLICMSPKPISPVSPISPSPTSSSSSNSSVPSPVSSCSKQAIMEAASAISEGKNEVAAEILTRLSQASNCKGSSEQRLMEYMCSALKSRVYPVDNPPPVGELFSMEHVESTQLLYEHSACFTLGFMAANLAILEATVDQPSCVKFHVIDFDIGQGGQYKNLLHELSMRSNGKLFVLKITAVAENVYEERLQKVGKELSLVAEGRGVSLHFNVVSLKLGELNRESLGVEPNELLAVNFAFKMFRMPDESVSTDNPRDELLRRVKGLAPRVVTLVEQEMNTNTAPFVARVNQACAYYGALFDSIDSTMQRESLDRVKVEEGLGRKLSNSVACEGKNRVERCEVFGKWRARMSMAGFASKPMSQNIAESMQNRLRGANRANPGFTVKEENGGVGFGWMGRTLTVASAWR